MPHFSIEAACSLEPGYSRIDSEVRGSAGYITSNVVQLGAHVRSRVFILIPAVLSMLYLASLQTRAVPTRRMLLTDLPGLSRAPILENVRPLRVLLATNAIVRIFYEPMHQLVGGNRLVTRGSNTLTFAVIIYLFERNSCPLGKWSVNDALKIECWIYFGIHCELKM